MNENNMVEDPTRPGAGINAKGQREVRPVGVEVVEVLAAAFDAAHGLADAPEGGEAVEDAVDESPDANAGEAVDEPAE